MARWICSNCEREFARRQSHVCVPGIRVDDLLGRHPAWVAAVYAEVIDHLRSLGEVHEDAVDVGVFLKSDRKLAEFRPRVRAAHLFLFLPHPVDDARVSRHLTLGQDRFMVVVKLTRPDDVDETVRDWLSEAFDVATDDAEPGTH